MKNGLLKKWLTVLFSLLFSFCFLCGCHRSNATVTVYIPDGAPSLAFAGLMCEDTKDDGVEYKVVAPNVIKSKVTGKNQGNNADICVLPVHTASALLGAGDRYQLLGVVTHGNLYMLSKTQETYTNETLVNLIGKVVGVLQIADVPGLTLKSILRANDVPYQEISAVEKANANVVNLLAITGAGDVGALPGVDAYVLAEPAVTMKVNAGAGLYLVGNLQTLYKAQGGYPQAVVVAKKSLIQKNPKFIQSFMQSLQNAKEWLKDATAQEIASIITAHLEDENYSSTIKAAALNEQTITRCAVYFTDAKQSKAEIEGYLTALSMVDGGKTRLPSSAFYFNG